MVVKVRIKAGNVELDYEGEEDFLRDEVPGLLDKISMHHATLQSAATSEISSQVEGSTSNRERESRDIQLSSNMVAQIMDAKNGSELALAAAAYLAIVNKKNTFSRKDILAAMQDATSYYKDTYGGHLTESLDKLAKDGKLVGRARDVYALHASQHEQLEALLAKA